MTAPRVRLQGIGKRFGELWAVRGVDLEIVGGRVHALLGENGAGKTTLMSMLAGLYRPDEGLIEVDGAPRELRSPRQAAALGIGMVHQHFMLVPGLSVAENVLLGAMGLPRLLRPARLRRQVADAAERLGLRVDPAAETGSLSVGEQQRVEILRVLGRGARVVILDEPTAVLAPDEAEALLATLRRLADEGCAVVLVSHKLEELRRAADRISVLRAGRLVAEVEDPAARSTEELAAMMLGEGGPASLTVERQPQAPGPLHGSLPLRTRMLGAPSGSPRLDISLRSVDPLLARLPAPPRLTARGLRVRSDRGLEAVRGVELTLHGGEVLGLAGVSGNGQGELLEALAGLRPLLGGEVVLEGELVSGAPVRRRAALGLRYVPEDRHRTGTSPSLSLLENLQLRSYRGPPARRGLLLDLRAAAQACRARLDELQIGAPLEQDARLLSGGNLQKLVLARELDPDGARVILCMHPTRGLDAWATAEVRRRLLEARGRGCAVLLCSEDLDEILALSDRVAVMLAGRVVHESVGAAADRLTIGRAMIGAPAAPSAKPCA